MKTKRKAWQFNADLNTAKTKNGGMTCNFAEEEGYEGGSYYTLQFSVFLPDKNTVRRTIANISIGVQGQNVNRQIDVNNGTSISFPAESCKVTVKDATEGAIVSGGQEYKVTGQITRGTRPSENQPPQLLGVDRTTVPANGTNISVIPPDAGAISVEVSALTADNSAVVGRIEQEDVTGNVVKAYAYTNPPVFVALAPGATQVKFTNASGATVQYALSFGIDG